MIKRKYFLKDIEVSRKLESGETLTVKADRCFTEESYVVIKLYSFSEKLKLQGQLKSAEKDADLNYKMICDLLDEVNCVSIDSDEVISNLDDLTVYADGGIVVEFLTALLGSGFVPKKISTV